MPCSLKAASIPTCPQPNCSEKVVGLKYRTKTARWCIPRSPSPTPIPRANSIGYKSSVQTRRWNCTNFQTIRTIISSSRHITTRAVKSKTNFWRSTLRTEFCRAIFPPRWERLSPCVNSISSHTMPYTTNKPSPNTRLKETMGRRIMR